MNATAACILGLLQLGPAPGQNGRADGAMTGWQIHDAAKVSVARFWNVTRSQIYRELAALERNGLVASAGPEGPRSGRPYAITSAGRTAFSTWILDFALSEPRDEQLHSPIVLTVFFGEFLPADAVTRVLVEHRARHRRHLERIRAMTSALPPQARKRLPSTVLDRGAAYQQLMIDWIDEVLAALAGEKG